MGEQTVGWHFTGLLVKETKNSLLREADQGQKLHSVGPCELRPKPSRSGNLGEPIQGTTGTMAEGTRLAFQTRNVASISANRAQ